MNQKMKALAAAALALPLFFTGCAANTGGPMTPYKLNKLIMDNDRAHKTANPLTDVACSPRPDVKADGSGTYDCSFTYQSHGVGDSRVLVNPDGTWSWA